MPARVLAHDLRALVQDVAPDVREGIRYGVPFFLVGAAPVCYLSAAKTHVTFGFPMGDRIDDASARLVGTGKSPIRKVAIPLEEALPHEARSWVEQAARLARAATAS